MTTAKPVVTNMADIDQLIASGNTSTPPATPTVTPAADAVAEYQASFERRAEVLCEAYVQHRIGGGKHKAFLATLSKDDLQFFEVMQLHTLAKLAIKQHLETKPEDSEAQAVYDTMVAQETKRLAAVADATGANLPGNPNFGKGKKKMASVGHARISEKKFKKLAKTHPQPDRLHRIAGEAYFI